jgi:hypothetical protein
LAGLWGDGIGELVNYYDAAEGGLVEARELSSLRSS